MLGLAVRSRPRPHTLALLLLIAPGAARGDQPMYFSTNAALTANSSMAYDQSGGAALLNPAGLAGGPDNRIDASGTAFVLRMRDYSRAVISDLPTSGHGTLDGATTDVAPVPSALVFVRRLHPKVWAALGIFVTDYDKVELVKSYQTLEQFPGSPHPTALALRGALGLLTQTYRIGPSFGVLAHPRLRVGFSLHVVYASSRYSSNFTVYGADLDGASNTSSVMTAQDIYEEQTTWVGGQVAASLQWNPIGPLHVGLMVRSPVLGVTGSSIVHRLGAAFSSGSAFPGPVVFKSDDSPVPSGAGRLREPFSATLGLALRSDRGAIGVEVDVAAPLDTPELNLDFVGQVNARVGAQLHLPRRFVLGGGLFTDRSNGGDRYPYTGRARSDYYGAALALGFDTVYPLAKSRPEEASRDLVFKTVVTATYALGLARVDGLHYAPTSTALPELSNLQPIVSDARFHAVTLQLASSLDF